MPFTCQRIPYALTIGLDVSVAFRDSETLFNPHELVSSTNFKHFDFIVACVSVKNIAKRFKFMTQPTTPVFVDDYYTISSSFYKTQFIAQLHNEDVDDVSTHMKAIMLDLNFCNHLCVSCISVDCPENGFTPAKQFDFVFLLQSFFKRNPDRKVNFVITFNYKQLRTYQQISSALGHIDNFRLAIKLTAADNNNTTCDSKLFKETTATNIVAVVVPISLFVKNKNGFPVLSKQIQSLLCELFTFKIDVVVKDDISTTQLLTQSETYLQQMYDYYVYIKHLFQNHATFTSTFDYVLCHYADVLQTPLQPLRDDLQSITYEAFEEDKVKYEQYACAIALAISDICGEVLLKQQQQLQLNIGVLGGGRGPLIRMVISAIQSVITTHNSNNANSVCLSKSNFRVFCVEKNINAFNTLLTLQQHEPHIFADVLMIHSDMRTFVPSLYNIPHIDICVSELLGSFGDNELSPECLSHITQYMSSYGVMIPQRYTSYIRPVYCLKTWMNIKLSNESYETPFIIKFKKAFYPIDEVKPCFSFKHESGKVECQEEKFNQQQSVEFVFDDDNVISGFAGYFEAVLYKDVVMSILPGNKHTSNLNSWFPVFFPSAKEVYVKKNEKLVINVRRVNDMRKVWYEWSFVGENDVYGVNYKVHNSNGDCYAMLL